MFWDALKWSYESAEHANLKAGPQAVLNALAYSMHPSTKACYPSITRLAALTHQAESTVERNLAILVKAGLVEIDRAKTEHDTNGYILNYTIIPKKGKKGKNPAAASDDEFANSAESSRTSAESTRTHTLDQSLNLRDSNLSIREGQPLKNDETNLSNRETNVQYNTSKNAAVASSSSISSQSDVDDDEQGKPVLTAPKGFTSWKWTKPAVLKSSDCYGFKKALQLVDEALPHLNSRDDAETGCNLNRRSLAEALALFHDPTPKDALDIFDLVEKNHEWLALDTTIESVRKQVDNHSQIHDMRKYFIESLLKNASNIRTREYWDSKHLDERLARYNYHW